MHRISILTGALLNKKYGFQEETAEQLIFEWECLGRKKAKKP